jgi:arylsulfatase A
MNRNFEKIVVFCALVLSILLIRTSAHGQSYKQPNIVLIMADDLGYEGLSCNGGQLYTTPVLDQLANTGIRFEHCYSQPLCTPSRVQIMTGRYNFRNYKMFAYLDSGETTFGNVMKDAGYTTCIAGKWQLSNGIEGPKHAGFDEYCLWQIYSFVAGKDVRGPRYTDPKVYVNGKTLENTKGKYGPDIFVDFINNFIRENKDKPFFVYYPMILTHAPFSPTPDSEEWDGDRYKKDKKFFRDMVEYMDKSVGRIVDQLDELGLRENTLIIFTGDNGSPRQINSKFNDGWVQGGKSYMTDAGTHVPLIANWPGTIPPGLVSDDLVDFSDFVPTFAEVGKAALPENKTIDGHSFLPQLLGEKGTPREWVFVHYWDRGRDVLKTREFARDKRYKLYDDGSFFDIVNDPLEENPIAEEMIHEELKATKLRLQKVIDNMK